MDAQTRAILDELHLEEMSLHEFENHQREEHYLNLEYWNDAFAESDDQQSFIDDYIYDTEILPQLWMNALVHGEV